MVWLGIILTVVFGLISLIQFLRDRANRRNILAAKASMESITLFCRETLEKNEKFQNDEAMRLFVRSVAHMVLASKRSLDTLLPTPKKKQLTKPNAT